MANINASGAIKAKINNDNYTIYPITRIANVDGLQTALDGKAAVNHTHSAFSTTSAGFVPAASSSGDTDKYLKGDGTWATPSGGGGGSGTVTGVKVGTTAYSPDSSGVVSIPAYPDISGKIDTAGTGLSKSGTTLNHSNSVTAKTTAGAYKIKFDSSGHITGTASLSYSDVGAASSGHTHSGYVSTSRTVNGYSLSSNVNLDYEDVGLKVSTQTLTLSSMSFTKSYGGMYYASSISPSTSYSQIFSITMNGFNNLPNMAFMPFVSNTNKIGLMVCAPAAPSSLSFSAGTIGITIVGI